MMKEMVLAAKQNRFERVEEILKKKRHLINGIPEARAWSALHQAVFHNNTKTVKMLLHFDNCDANIRAKRDRNRLTDPGDKPIKLAKCQEIKDLLKEKDSSFLSDVPTFVEEELGDFISKRVFLCF